MSKSNTQITPCKTIKADLYVRPSHFVSGTADEARKEIWRINRHLSQCITLLERAGSDNDRAKFQRRIYIACECLRIAEREECWLSMDELDKATRACSRDRKEAAA